MHFILNVSSWFAGVSAGLLLLGCSGGEWAWPDSRPVAGGPSAGLAGAAAGVPAFGGGGAAGAMGFAGGSGAEAAGNGAGGTTPGTGLGGSSGSREEGAGRGGLGGGPGGAERCVGKPGALHGKSNQSVDAGGLTRTFVYYAPANLDPNAAVPVVIVPHGWLMSGQQMFDITQYDAIAEREGFVVLYPDGEPGSIGPWNVGQGACPSTTGLLPLATGNDQAFIDAMLAFAEGDRCIDREHVFVTGFSMGGYFANEVGCLRNDIAAIGPHSGGSHDLSACPTTRKPAILFHGAVDGLIPASCGKEARDRWAARNGCDSQVETRVVRGGQCEYSKGCPADGQVVLCLFDGMDHGWAGGQGSFGFPEYESAAELGWEFFEDYAW